MKIQDILHVEILAIYQNVQFHERSVDTYLGGNVGITNFCQVVKFTQISMYTEVSKILNRLDLLHFNIHISGLKVIYFQTFVTWLLKAFIGV